MKKSGKIVLCAAGGILLLAAAIAIQFAARFRRPFREVVEHSGVEPALAYAVMKAESGFDEDAESGAGALGLMQLLPATAEFVCRLYALPFDAAKLKEGAYNARLGCLYLGYLLKRFPVAETAVAAYNAGEGTVALWLSDGEYSDDGRVLKSIPYRETAEYVKKVGKFRKKYLIFYN